MFEVFSKIPKNEEKKFSMPLSLRIIKECSQYGIEWKGLHIADLFSIIYSVRIDKANDYLYQQRQSKLHQKGISSMRKATQEDFDKL